MITRSALARDIGVDRVTLWRWEASGRVPGPSVRPSGRSYYTPADAAAIRAFAQVAA